MSRIRVLIVDDSVVVRRLVSDVLDDNPLIEVASVAPNGRIALSKIVQFQPDVVTLDVEMPEMDGLATLKEIRRLYPKLPVIMFSTMTERGAAATVEALAGGANDYVTKPANVGSVTAAMEQVRGVLIPKIMAACPGKVSSTPRTTVVVAPNRAHRKDERVDIVAIASSTGGPNALNRLLSLLPGDLPVPVVIVQHMPAMFTRLLADQLQKRIPLACSEAADGDLLQPGHVLIAPGDFHLEVVRSGTSRIEAKLSQGTPENSCRPSADVLFRSVASVFGNRALAVVLTGMGRDGCLGSQAICDAGGRAIVQDEASSVVWGMAGSVARANLADGAWPIEGLAEEVIRRLQVTRPLWNPHPVVHA